jgi:hypothetical protein
MVERNFGQFLWELKVINMSMKDIIGQTMRDNTALTDAQKTKDPAIDTPFTVGLKRLLYDLQARIAALEHQNAKIIAILQRLTGGG